MRRGYVNNYKKILLLLEAVEDHKNRTAFPVGVTQKTGRKMAEHIRVGKMKPGSKSVMSHDVQISIYEQPFYRWRELYERMKINQAK